MSWKTLKRSITSSPPNNFFMRAPNDQHFLVDDNAVERIADAVPVFDRDVLEIGPGGGVLTAALLERGAHVRAVELDTGLLPNLERRFSVCANEENLGSYELSLEIYNNQLELVAEETCTLVLVEVDLEKKEESRKVLQFSEVPENCLEQVMCSVDTEYNGTFEALKPEGVAQMQDVVCSVLSGI